MLPCLFLPLLSFVFAIALVGCKPYKGCLDSLPLVNIIKLGICHLPKEIENTYFVF
ncbi:hypothetical protein EZS27_021234 [termite gut metagenome]|uniref:Uncharacterized protein n=1 Tax=termite gut metagenome TaxID=433724 RepID=A0A5J4R8J5_9ZZZZ